MRLVDGDVVLRRDLVQAGWSDADLHAMVEHQVLRRLAHGVLAVGAAPSDPLLEHAQRATGIARWHGDRIALSGLSALSPLGLPLDGYLDFSRRVQAIRVRGGARSSRNQQILRLRSIPRTVELVGGGRVCVPVAAALHVAADSSHVAGVVTLDACLQAGLFTTSELAAEAEGLLGTEGAAAARAAVVASRLGAQSPRETELRLLVHDLGLETDTQFPVSETPTGEPFAFADLRVRGTRLLLEYDGEEKYAAGDAIPLVSEKQREDRIRRLGWGLERVTKRDFTMPESLRRRVWQAAQDWREAA